MTDCKENNIGLAAADDVVMGQDMAVCMDKFARTFEASARRWELVVYPSLIAFIVLASYGFYLIYTLTTDVGRLARSMESVVVAMDNVVTDMNVVSGNVALISGNLGTIATEVSSEDGTMKNMLVKMENMNKTMGVISVPMHHMRNDMARMSHNVNKVAGPMRAMGDMFPF
jgi:hypothetical protein